ncbi:MULTISPECIES: hypothetical protein [unclassified Moorena]|nr:MULTISPECIES: hypothetical protein [unclassified Moorena]NEP33485.1 hypothetical protein [Moorena sp. SIO3B2]NEQ07905.1 hypothetical protein [Moorena sp. SIO4E2]NEQ12839.1 hypothetical protein [Moorena sp. SIO3E2]NES44434.1 hypothetical protein [Moorena sp. SIO2C4]
MRSLSVFIGFKHCPPSLTFSIVINPEVGSAINAIAICFYWFQALPTLPNYIR